MALTDCFVFLYSVPQQFYMFVHMYNVCPEMEQVEGNISIFVFTDSWFRFNFLKEIAPQNIGHNNKYK